MARSLIAQPTILFRCDGSSVIGLGHVVRCLALAEELRESYSCHIAFAMRQDPLCFDMVRGEGYEVNSPTNDGDTFDYQQWIASLVNAIKPNVLVLDVRDDLPIDALQDLRKKGILIVTIDDDSNRRLVSDLAFYPPVPQVRKIDWTGFSGELHVGWEWVVLRREFGEHVLRIPHEPPVVLVTMGGSDPAGLTLKAIKALEMLDENFETWVVLGPGFSHHEAIQSLIATTRRQFKLLLNVDDMPSLMAHADLAVASFGVTAYELAAIGAPAVYLCLTDDHAESASVFMNNGVAVCLGTHFHVELKTLVQAIRSLLKDKKLRSEMAQRARHFMDGKGSERISRVIMQKLKLTCICN